MSVFRGSFNSQIQENHVFLSDDPIMEAIGLSSFTNKSFREIIANNLDGIKLVYPELANYLDSIYNDGLLIDLVDPQSGTYRKFNATNLAFETETISVSEVKELIEYHELKSKTPDKKIDEIKNEDKDKQILDIQNSLTKSVLFTLSKSAFGITDNNNPDVRINLFFTKANQSSNKRIMAQKGAPMIVDVPTRSTGGAYGYRATKQTQQADGVNSIGQYEIASNDGIEDMQNAVGARLKLTYNQNTAMWESGTTQILAKLTEDVPAAEIKNVQIGPNDIDSITGSENYYVADSQYYMGGHVTTLAIPLSIENGNPHLFGPNLLKCKNGKPETLRAVNRAPRSFSAGSVVLLSNIDGEWIIQDFGANPEDLKPSTTSFGEWSFTKLIADSDAYFKDQRFYTQVDGYGNSITPSIYEYESRLRFHSNVFREMTSSLEGIYANDIFKKLTALNSGFIKSTPSIQLQPSTRYYISTIFDQVAKENGGFSTKTYISNTNLKSPDFIGKEVSTASVPIFWGPVFVDGYKTFKVEIPSTEIKLDRNTDFFINPYSSDNVNIYLNDNILSKTRYTISDNSILFQPPAASGSVLKIIPNDSNLYYNNLNVLNGLPVTVSGLDPAHCPAEMTSKIIDIIPIRDNWHSLGATDIKLNYIKPPFYKSTVNSLNSVQFSPLQVDFAAHDDPVSRLAKYTQRQYYTNLRNFIDIDPKDSNLFGNMYERSKQFTYDIIRTEDKVTVGNTQLIPFIFSNLDILFSKLTECDAYNNINNKFSLASWENSQFLAYDCYIKRRPTNTPVGAPLPEFSNGPSDFHGANLVGVVAGKQTIIKPRGGVVNFRCEQFFGLPKIKTTSGQGGILSIVLGVVVNAVSPSTKSLGFSQWGSSIGDRYDSFGTTALHVRIFDYWPEENTIYDPRYYGVLHFNPGELHSTITKKSEGLKADADIQQKYGNQYSLANLPPKISYSDIKRDVDQTTVITNSIDIRIPTFGVKFNDNGPPDVSKNGDIVRIGAEVNSDFFPLRPNNEWRINPIRRGQMLTNGGFNYLYHAIGLGDSWQITKAGSGFGNDQKLTLAGSKSIEIELVTNDAGEITDFSFISTNESLQSENGRGMNFLPSDFGSQSSIPNESRKCYKLNIPAPAGGESAIIEFYSGLVYLRQGFDSGPKEQKPPTLLSTSSDQGENIVQATKNTELSLDENNSGKYDCFYFFHNDVTHTPLDPFQRQNDWAPAQHITLTVS